MAGIVADPHVLERNLKLSFRAARRRLPVCLGQLENASRVATIEGFSAG